jgi:HAD superfamily hydrolase (TIGR01509 family)
MRHIQAFLFDLDETLLRGSLQAHREAWNIAIHECLSRQGTLKADETLSLPDMEFFFEQEGQSSTIITALLLEKLGFSSNQQLVDQIVERKTALTRELYAPTPAPHAQEVLEALKTRGKRLAVVTGTSRHVAVAVIEKMFEKTFDVLISGNDVTQSKPHPEPYQQAVKKLALPPAQCVAVENSPLGIESAKAAGIFTVAVPFTLPPERLQKADHIVRDLKELLEL